MEAYYAARLARSRSVEEDPSFKDLIDISGTGEDITLPQKEPEIEYARDEKGIFAVIKGRKIRLIRTYESADFYLRRAEEFENLAKYPNIISHADRIESAYSFDIPWIQGWLGYGIHKIEFRTFGFRKR